MSAQRTRCGIALAAAVYAVAISGVVVGAVLFATTQASRAGEAGRRDAVLGAAADYVLAGAIDDWSPAVRARQAVGSTESQSVNVPDEPSLAATLRIARLNATVYWLVADLVQPADLRLRLAAPTRRRVTMLVRVPPFAPALQVPLVAAGDVVLGAGARIDTTSASGAGDDGSCTNAPAAVMLAPAARLQLAPDYPAAAEPLLLRSGSAADPRTYAAFGEDSWSALAARADITVPAGAHVTPMPVADTTTCIASPGNWGDARRDTPAGACESRAPLVYAAGDLTIDGGIGQGVLLVEGRLHLGGPLRFSGLVVARGGVDTFADGVRLSGIVLSASTGAADGPAPSVSLAHDIIIRYSRCDAAHGMASSLGARPVHLRAWAEPF